MLKQKRNITRSLICYNEVLASPPDSENDHFPLQEDAQPGQMLAEQCS